jgi:hypothetical protein
LQQESQTILRSFSFKACFVPALQDGILEMSVCLKMIAANVVMFLDHFNFFFSKMQVNKKQDRPKATGEKCISFKFPFVHVGFF